MEKLILDKEYIALCDLLKALGWSDSGGQAKILIADGLVSVDGKQELRKRCKITAGKVVEFDGMKAIVESE